MPTNYYVALFTIQPETDLYHVVTGAIEVDGSADIAVAAFIGDLIEKADTGNVMLAVWPDGKVVIPDIMNAARIASDSLKCDPGSAFFAGGRAANDPSAMVYYVASSDLTMFSNLCFSAGQTDGLTWAEEQKDKGIVGG